MYDTESFLFYSVTVFL